MFKKKKFLVPMRLKLIQSISSPRVFIGYLYGFWLGFFMGLRYGAFSSGMEIGIFESFLLITNQSFNLSLMLIGFFILIADAPFIDSQAYYILIRSGSKSWRISMVGYIGTQIMIYESLIFLGGILSCIPLKNFTLDWSATMKILTGAAPKIAILDYQLPILDKWMLTAWSAPLAFFHSFLLTLSYCFFLGLTIFIGNLNSALPIGNLIAIGIHFIGMLVMSDFIPLYWPSMAAHSMLQYHIPGRGVLSLYKSYLLFAVCIAIALIILRKVSRHIDYLGAVSQKTW